MRRRRKGRIWLPGEAGDEFLGEDTGGEAGQYVTLSHDFRYVMDPRDLAVWPEIPDLLWVAGDGNTPTIGPTFAATGAPLASMSPYQTQDGSAVVSEEYLIGVFRSTAVDLDPAAGEDVVWAGVAVRDPVAVTDSPGGNWSTRGVTIYTGVSGRITCQVTGNATISIATLPDIVPSSSLFIWTVVIDRDGNTYFFINGNLIGSNATPAGALGTAAGFGIGATAAGTLQWENGKILFQYWKTGTGIADKWLAGSNAIVEELFHRFVGTYPIQGGVGAFTRASAASWQDRTGRYHIASNELPRAGDSGGLHLSASRTNKAYRNINPQNTTALTWTGAKAPTVVNDSVALTAQGCEVWGPNAYEYVNDTGATRYIRMSATTGNLNAHSLQCLVRQLASSGTKLGLYDVSAGTFVGSAIHDGYDARTLIHGQVPTDTDQTLCLEVPNGVTIRWIAHDMSQISRCYYPIPNWATAASAVKAADSLTFSGTPADAQGSIELDVTPRTWSAAEAGTVTVLQRNSQPILYAESGTWRCNIDGTTALNSGVAPSDGTTNKIRLRWKGALMSIDVDGTRVTGAYDGSLRGSGAWIVPLTAVTSIDGMRTYRNGDG